MSFQERSPSIPGGPDVFSTYSTRVVPLGSEVKFADGRVFRFALNGGTALEAGKLCQAAAPVANHLNCAVAASASVGDTSISVTLGATAADANAYKDGYVHINTSDGAGNLYRIKNHAAISSGGTGTFYLMDPIREALTTSSKATFTKNPYDSVVVMPTTATSIPVGIPPVDVAANAYFWIQVRGVATCLLSGTVVIGQHVRVSTAAAGAVTPLDRDGTGEDYANVGLVLRVNSTAQYGLIYLTLG